MFNLFLIYCFILGFRIISCLIEVFNEYLLSDCVDR